MFSVCVLLYGDHPGLAARCLESISRAVGDFDGIQDVRIGMNEVSEATKKFVERWALSFMHLQRRPVIAYDSPRNAMKYREPRPLADYVMWFDDDAFVQATAAGNDLFRRCRDKLRTEWAIGQKKFIRTISPGQIDWIKAQPWYAGNKINRDFMQGSWWCMRSQLVTLLDWPSPWLRHRGGDVMLGRALEQRIGIWVNDPSGVCLNCDEAGRDSASPRRGLTTEKPVGWDYKPGDKPDPAIHDFPLTTMEWRPK